jgi:hypothetical protein
VHAPPAVGLLVLRDLDELYSWSKLRGPDLLARLDLAPGELLPPSSAPPAALVLVIGADGPSDPLRHRGWLARAGAIVLVIDTTSRLDGDDDPEIVELLDYELTTTCEALGNVAAVVRWDGADPAVLRAAVDQARDLSLRPAPAPPPPQPRPACEPGPWLPWYTTQRTSSLDLEDALHRLSQGLCAPDGRPSLRCADHLIDLRTGARTPAPPLDHYHFAVSFDGARILTRAPGARDSGWRLTADGHDPRDIPGPWGRPINFDPWGRFIWVGHRCRYYWLTPADQAVAHWTGSEHDFPCGHAKKLWGYKDNDPLWVHLAPDAAACLSHYEHDVLLTAGLPLRWRAAGDVALGLRNAAPWRVLVHAHDPDGFPADPQAADEDARHMFATTVLGPDPAHRYAVSLEHRTWRVLGDQASHLGGPEDAWLLFDVNHQIVRRGAGRLLAGWHEHAVILERGQLRREHLATAEHHPLGPEPLPIAGAVPLAGTPNVVLVHLADDGPHLRLV